MNEYRKNKGYRALINAALLNGIGNSLFNIVFIIYASTTPFKGMAVSLASMALLIPSLLNIITGYLADQTRHKTRWMIISRIGQFLLFILLTIAIRLPSSVPLFLLLLFINIVSDCLGAYGGGLQLPLLRRLIPEELLEEALGFQTATQTLVQIIFQGVGAWVIILLRYDFSAFGLINAGTFLLAGAAIFQQRKLLRAAEPNHHSIKTQAKSGFKSNLLETLQLLYTNRFLKIIALFALAVNTLGTCIDGLMNVSLLTIEPMWLGNYGNTLAVIGITLSAGIIIGSLFTNDFLKSVSTLPLISATMVVLGVLALNFLIFKHSLLMIVCLFIVGYLTGKMNPRVSAYMMRQIDEKQLAVTSGIFNTLVLLGGPVGQAVFLGIANTLTPVFSWQIYLVATLLISIFALIYSRRVAEPSVITVDLEEEK
ncbi:MFS transporter [Enterococcus sp. LJL51]|uniref:MFS transporter n=1 Tax=Enterococcus sp. LJL51 TaxID=3416656 RepID=UPI003CE743E9